MDLVEGNVMNSSYNGHMVWSSSNLLNDPMKALQNFETHGFITAYFDVPNS
jgi:hypothetical protein